MHGLNIRRHNALIGRSAERDGNRGGDGQWKPFVRESPSLRVGSLYPAAPRGRGLAPFLVNPLDQALGGRCFHCTPYCTPRA